MYTNFINMDHILIELGHFVFDIFNFLFLIEKQYHSNFKKLKQIFSFQKWSTLFISVCERKYWYMGRMFQIIFFKYYIKKSICDHTDINYSVHLQL